MNDPTQQPRQTQQTRADGLVAVPGGHPVATVVGAVVMAAASGAVVGTAAGPVGTVVGAVVGAVVGGMGGDAIASSVEEAHDASYWRENYRSRPYVDAGANYGDFGPAFAFGSQSRRRYEGRTFDQVQSDLMADWEGARATSNLSWDRARHAARDAWERDSNPPRQSV